MDDALGAAQAVEYKEGTTTTTLRAMVTDLPDIEENEDRNSRRKISSQVRITFPAARLNPSRSASFVLEGGYEYHIQQIHSGLVFVSCVCSFKQVVGAGIQRTL